MGKISYFGISNLVFSKVERFESLEKMLIWKSPSTHVLMMLCSHEGPTKKLSRDFFSASKTVISVLIISLALESHLLTMNPVIY